MRSELRCDDVRVELSARLDGEIDARTEELVVEHLGTCRECRAHEERLQRIRHSIRVQPSPRVPDLTRSIMDRVASRPVGRGFAWPQIRTAAIAAAATALIVLGASLPGSDAPPDTARAAEIVRSIKTAARTLTSYHATFTVTELGWHPDVLRRRFSSEVWWRAPEKFRLQVRDLTVYPNADWPHNDIDLIASPRRYRIEEPSTCPTAALPRCSVFQGVETRTIVDRQPFDGNSRLPTDIALPLETLSSAEGLEVVEPGTYLGRDVERVRLPVAVALPLLRSIQVGGDWRAFHLRDRVELWIDRATWFPLRFIVTAGSSSDRSLWAQRMGYVSDRPGAELLDVQATRFSESNDFDPALFRSRVEGAVLDGGFTAQAVPGDLAAGVAGLEPYRVGSVRSQTISTFATGMYFLKVTSDRDRVGSAADLIDGSVVKVGEGFGLYHPASERSARKIDLFTRRGRTTLETNLPRTQLLRIAAPMASGSVIPSKIDGVLRLTETHLARTKALVPSWMPEGFVRTSALMSTADRTVTITYQRPETSFAGIRITQTPLVRRLQPTAEQTIAIELDDVVARWSFERSELEWIDGNVYRAVATSGGDLATAVQIARSLR